MLVKKQWTDYGTTTLQGVKFVDKEDAFKFVLFFGGTYEKLDD